MEAKYTLCGVAAQWWIYCMVSCCFHSTRLASVWSVSQSMSLLDKSTFLLLLLDIAIMCDLCFYLLFNECCCIWQSILSPTIHLYRCNCTTELQEQQQHLWRRLPWTIRDYPCWFTASIDMPDIWMFTSDEPGLDLIHSHTLCCGSRLFVVCSTINSAAAQVVAPALNHRRHAAADAEWKPLIPDAPCVPANMFHAGTYENENVWTIQVGFLYRKKIGCYLVSAWLLHLLVYFGSQLGILLKIAGSSMVISTSVTQGHWRKQGENKLPTGHGWDMENCPIWKLVSISPLDSCK